MPDPSELLQQIYAAGFELQTFDRYPTAVGVSRGDCIVLLEPAETGLRMIGAPGWKIGDAIGVLTTREGKPVFQHKSELVAATAERLHQLAAFRQDIEHLLLGRPA